MSKLPQIYYTDDFPREDCKIELQLFLEGDGYTVTICAPKHYGSTMLESYFAKDINVALHMIEDLALGRKVPRKANDGAYSSSSS